MRPDLHSERYGLLTSWYRSSQPTDARATGLVCIAVAVPFWASRPRFELTKAKSVRYLFPMFGTRGAHIAVIAEHEHHLRLASPLGPVRRFNLAHPELLIP